MARPAYAQRAHINRDSRFDQFKIDIGYMEGSDFIPADVLYTNERPEMIAERYYPGIETERFGSAIEMEPK